MKEICNLIVKEEGICIYRQPIYPPMSRKQAQSFAILCEDQERATELAIKNGAYVCMEAGKPLLEIGSIYPVPGIEFEEVNTCKWHGNLDACGNETCWDLVECQKSPSKTVARLIEHAEKGYDHSWDDTMTVAAGIESPEIDKEEELKRLQEENTRLKENYDHSQRVLDSYRKLLEEEKSRTEELEKLLKLERQSNPNKAPF